MLSDLHYSEPADPTQAPVSSQQTHHRVVCNLNRAGQTLGQRQARRGISHHRISVCTSIRLLHWRPYL